MFTGLMTQSATRLRAALIEDPYSGEDTKPDWGSPGRPPKTPPDRLIIEKASIQPVQSGEVTFDRDTFTARWWLWCPGHPDINGRDRIEYAGEFYEIEGDVMQWPGRLPHTQLMLKKVDG